MARRLIIHLLIFIATAASLLAADPEPRREPPPRKDRPEGKTKLKPRPADKEKVNSSEARKAREVVRSMTPEERRDFMENFRRWKEMPPERKGTLLKRQETFRERVKKDIEDAIADSGLTLNEAEEREFSKRYSKGRREIEEDLRRQMDEMRKPRLKALVESLKLEFATPAPAAQTGG